MPPSIRASPSPAAGPIAAARDEAAFSPLRRPSRALCILAIVILLVLAAPLVATALGHDVNEADLLLRYQPPSLDHPLGTDEIGRDVLLRLLYGGRVSLSVGLIAAALAAATIGTIIGIIAGYFGGRFDTLLMRVTDGVIALPLLPLLIVLAAIDLAKLGLPAGNRAVGAGRPLPHHRHHRAGRLDHRRAPGARHDAGLRRAATSCAPPSAIGASPARVMAVHILPNAISPIIVATTLVRRQHHPVRDPC